MLFPVCTCRLLCFVFSLPWRVACVSVSQNVNPQPVALFFLEGYNERRRTRRLPARRRGGPQAARGVSQARRGDGRSRPHHIVLLYVACWKGGGALGGLTKRTPVRPFLRRAAGHGQAHTGQQERRAADPAADDDAGRGGQEDGGARGQRGHCQRPVAGQGVRAQLCLQGLPQVGQRGPRGQRHVQDGAQLCHCRDVPRAPEELWRARPRRTFTTTALT